MSEASGPAALIAAGGAVFLVMAATAAITRRTGKAAYVDAAWGAAFVALGWAAAITVIAGGRPLSWRAWVLLILVTVWGTRLSWHLARRVLASDHDDPRYEEFLGGPVSTVPLSRVLAKVFGLQALLVLIVGLPVVVGIARAATSPWLVVVLGGAMWLAGAVIEATADAQLAAHRAEPTRPGLLTTGLWAWSRHPNYFGDFCVWWGLWLVGGAASGLRDGLVSLLSPVLMSWILIAVSGVRLAEKRMRGRPGWTAYVARTPIFVPWPPSRRGPSR